MHQRLATLVLASAFAAGTFGAAAFAGAPAYAAAADAESKRKLTRAFYEDVFNKHDPNAADKYIAANGVDHSPMPGQKPGLAGVKATFAAMFKAMPDLHATVDDILVDGDRVVARVTLTGTAKNALGPMKPTGKKIKVTGLDYLVIKDGKLIERWGYDDHMAFMQGFMPPAGGHH